MASFFVDTWNFNDRASEHRETLPQEAKRDWRDGREDVGIQSVHITPFSHVSRFTLHGLWRWRIFSGVSISILLGACPALSD